jgi:hypothetical protein
MKTIVSEINFLEEKIEISGISLCCFFNKTAG